MKQLQLAVAVIVASMVCAGSPVPPTSQSVPHQPSQQQVNGVGGLVPIVALSYLQQVAGAFRNAKSSVTRFSRVFAFSFANLPISFDGMTLKIPSTSGDTGKPEPSELGSLLLDMDSLSNSMSVASGTTHDIESLHSLEHKMSANSAVARIIASLY